MPVDQPPPVATVEVRAARLPPTPGEAAFSIVTIPKSGLQVRERLDEALENVPGLSQFRRTLSLAANPTTQGVSLRSFAPSGDGRTLVTLDGVPQNDPFGGWVTWTALPAESLSGAEIIRGAGAGPYGAGALTGVIALDEASPTPGGYDLDVSDGEHGYDRAGGYGAVAAGPIDLMAIGSVEHDHGWIPVIAGRGAADDALTLNDWSYALKAQSDLGSGVLALRAGAFQEDRASGEIGANARERGDFASATFAATPTNQGWAWRLQTWLRQSNLYNTSVSIAPGRQSDTPADDQYSTPATGYGFNGALRREGAGFDFELGADVRAAQGDDHELFHYVAGALTQNRDAGGRTLVAGAYFDADKSLGPWLLTGDIRADYWASTDGHRIESEVSNGAITLDQHDPDRAGVLPTARVGLRRSLDSGLYLRAAAYEGFRPPTLNELYRPFRVGNNITEANPNLRPEQLQGVEVGFGGSGASSNWSLTAFANRLQQAVTNVTIGAGPGTFPGFPEDFVPAGGILYQRQNAGQIDAYGLEASAEHRFAETFLVKAALDLTDAQVDGGSEAPQLTGLRPAQSPRLTLTGEADWRPLARLTLSAEVRYEGMRFNDDLNTQPLAPATTVAAQARWRLTDHADVYVAADNLFGVRVETDETAGGVFSYDEPRMVRIGFTLHR